MVRRISSENRKIIGQFIAEYEAQMKIDNEKKKKTVESRKSSTCSVRKSAKAKKRPSIHTAPKKGKIRHTASKKLRSDHLTRTATPNMEAIKMKMAADKKAADEATMARIKSLAQPKKVYVIPEIVPKQPPQTYGNTMSDRLKSLSEPRRNRACMNYAEYIPLAERNRVSPAALTFQVTRRLTQLAAPKVDFSRAPRRRRISKLMKSDSVSELSVANMHPQTVRCH